METDFVVPRLLPRIIDRGAGRDTDGSPPYGALYPSFFERITMSSDVVDVFLYNTAKDSDGGAWTNGPLAQASSWYNEQLNTVTRGATREFPKLDLIVAEAGAYNFFNAIDYDVPMWLIGISAIDNGVEGVISSVAMMNSELVVGSDLGVYRINFLKDQIRKLDSLGEYLYNGSISERNDAKGFTAV